MRLFMAIPIIAALIRVFEIFGSFNDSIGDRVRLRRPEISPSWFELVLVCEVSMDASFYGGCIDTLGGRRYRSLLTVASLFLPRGSQFYRKNRPLSSPQQFISGVVDTGQK